MTRAESCRVVGVSALFLLGGLLAGPFAPLFTLAGLVFVCADVLRERR